MKLAILNDDLTIFKTFLSIEDLILYLYSNTSTNDNRRSLIKENRNRMIENIRKK